MGLLQWGDFTLHAGGKSWWRIDCDGFSDSEVQLLARMILERARPFRDVVCPPSHPGSMAPKLVLAIKEQGRLYKKPNHFIDSLLIVDDVLTTGTSLEETKHTYRAGDGAQGFVVFARGKCPDWVTPLFQVTESLA